METAFRSFTKYQLSFQLKMFRYVETFSTSSIYQSGHFAQFGNPFLKRFFHAIVAQNAVKGWCDCNKRI